jgi:serine/threonine protein kinase
VPLLPGVRLGPYEVLAPLGAGGMGEVYRARDTRLHRDVAIKVLPASFSADPDRLRRFEQEARAASALNQPNILTIHDIGTHEGAPYLVSELLEGESLRERLEGGGLKPAAAVDAAVQVAQGLAAAHEKGIVHRDLKPENLFVLRDGRVKILDFGLAKLTRPEPASSGESHVVTTPVETEPGTVMGTLGYMSPEQLRGQAADHRSDIFSLGAILYEMLAGRRPFLGSTPVDTIGAILKEEPPELSETAEGVAPGLERIARRCLEKNPEARFQTARDLAFALKESLVLSSASPAAVRQVPRRHVPALRLGLLGVAVGALIIIVTARVGLLRRWWPGSARTGPIASIAVLPLKNLSGDPQQAFFVDGITEALTSSLAQIRSLKVIARTSSEQYKESKKPLREIARDLDVDSVVEGSITFLERLGLPGERARVAVSP